MRASTFFVLGIMLGISACRDDSTGLDAPTTLATVVFIYSASTSTDPSVAAMHSQCVQVGSEQRIRISDPNACALNATGASTDGVSANGTLLTRVVDTPGSGVEPGLAFEVAADGSVTP